MMTIPVSTGSIPSRRTVVIVGTGGTIASRERVPGMAEVASGAADLLAELSPVPGLDVRATDFAAHYPLGWDLQWGLLCELAAFLQEELKKPEVAGVVVTHGTDVLEEVACFLSLVVASEKPIVMTGAMRNQSLPGFDGMRNLHDAVIVAGDEEARGRGVMVCMNGTLLPAADATKMHTSAVDAFGSPNGKSLGHVGAEGPRFNTPPCPTSHLAVDARRAPNVPLLWTYSCANGATLAKLAQDCDGVVIAGTGLGHVPSAWMADIEALITNGVPVLMASRCGSGATGLGYAGAGGDFHLADTGALFAGDKRPLQARMELMCALSAGMTLDALRALFPTPRRLVQAARDLAGQPG
ncbi:asparaginase [Arthrobacter sp. CAU 1506]|uniref:asparaginase n=1 Tax=Arthrobacter sp. CAU 1506 TaxID=2560052 RepID=UPI0010AD5C0F|nr:asparaginase [Arthrobacter sp. CAU 1506]TJY64099.1 asparaginase [Arthrobacter sp. CAU 1506]